MLTLATAGLKPCETTAGSNSDSTSCRLCTNIADGYDAVADGPLCATCAKTRSVDEDTVEGHNA